MLFDVIYPYNLSPGYLDRLLAQGWFRYGQSFQKPEVICIDDEVCDVLNIRLNLKEHTFSKSQKKILRKNDKKFTVKIKKASITEEKENLYQKNQFRFKGFLTKNLEDFLTFGFGHSVFNTYQIDVYDNKKLVAFSYFDLGNNSMAALLGIIDWNYKKESLGIYTMLKELEFAKQKKLKLYYPGPITVQASTFDYKLKLGNFSYLAKTKRWRKLIDKQTDSCFANIINEKTLELEQALKQKEIVHETFAYPLYSIDFMPPDFSDLNAIKFLNTCKFVLIKRISKKKIEIAYYDLVAKQFKLAVAKRVNPKSLQINKMSKETYTIKSIYTHILKIVDCRKMTSTAVSLFA